MAQMWKEYHIKNVYSFEILPSLFKIFVKNEKKIVFLLFEQTKKKSDIPPSEILHSKNRLTFISYTIHRLGFEFILGQI